MVTVIADVTVPITETYTQSPSGEGSLQVFIEPSDVVSAGARWRRVGTDPLLGSGDLEEGIPVGDYEIEFKPVEGWETPARQTVTIGANETAVRRGTYSRTPQPVLEVFPDIQDVLRQAGGANFSVVNGGTGTMDWSASVVSGGSWLGISSGGTGQNSGTITTSFFENTGVDPRIGTIRVNSDGAVGSPKEVTVTQAGVGVDPGPILTVLSPNGGEILTRDIAYDIAWDSAGSVGGSVKLKLFKGGAFHQWISGPTPNDGVYRWTVPLDVPEGSDYTITVYSASDFSIKDFSDGTFTIGDPPIRMLAPDGGERWTRGNSYEIRWESDGFIGDAVKLKLYKAGAFHSWISGPTPNDGLYRWGIPSDMPESSDYTIKVYSASDFSIKDFSDGTFWIGDSSLTLLSPNGGDSWVPKGTYQISWDRTGPVGPDIKLKLYKGGRFMRWISGPWPAGVGEREWIVPGDLPYGSDYSVKIYSASDFALADFSDSAFSVASLRLSEPGPGVQWAPGSPQWIVWESTEAEESEVGLNLFSNGSFHSPISGPTANDYSYLWQIPSDMEQGSEYRIQVYSVANSSNQDFSERLKIARAPLQLTSPEVGEYWAVSTAQLITWTGTGIGGNVKLKLYRDGKFHSWISGPTPNDGEYSWRIPLDVPPGSTYTLQIYSAEDFSLKDHSDGNFFIIESPLRLQSPNGGDKVMKSSQHMIQWVHTDEAGASAKIKLFKGGVFDRWISGPTANDDSFRWRVPGDLPPASDYAVKIYSASDFGIQDFSDVPFSVVNSPLHLLSPDGGERWSRGSSHTITWGWSSEEVGSHIKIKLFKNGRFNRWISGPTPNDCVFAWQIPADVPIGTDYQIQIYSADDFSIADFSDGRFSIND